MSYLNACMVLDRAVASAILHWFHEDPYPIWDRLLGVLLVLIQINMSLGLMIGRIDTSRFRGIMEHRNVNKRILDRALWCLVSSVWIPAQFVKMFDKSGYWTSL